MKTAIYSILHLLVDGGCAWAMFGRFIPEADGYFHILVYNFCAFALQMPFGAVLDSMAARRDRDWPLLWALLGTVVTVLGALTHPAVLGMGNALFHVGGGVGAIFEDWHHHWKGRALGIFVAPGALGLFLGTQIAKARPDAPYLICSCVLMAVLLFPAMGREPVPAADCPDRKNPSPLPAVLCFAVVVLRSWVGMSVTFPWKTGLLFGTVSTLSVVLGKMAGGLLAPKFGTKRVVVASLALSAVCYALGDVPVFGVLALFLFNMTMPITLYELVCRFPKLPGFSFGMLTFALFLGFLPAYFRLPLPISGAAASLISLVLLDKAVDHA